MLQRHVLLAKVALVLFTVNTKIIDFVSAFDDFASHVVAERELTIHQLTNFNHVIVYLYPT